MYPGYNNRLQNLFRSVDSDHNGGIDSRELQRALSNGMGTTFNPNTVNLLLSMFDRDRNGVIDFNEFSGLFDYVERWKSSFQMADRDRSGAIDANELFAALSTFGYRLSPNFVNMLVSRFDRTHRGAISFDDYIYACVCLQILTNAFRPHDCGNGTAMLSFERFLQAALSIIIN